MVLVKAPTKVILIHCYYVYIVNITNTEVTVLKKSYNKHKLPYTL